MTYASTTTVAFEKSIADIITLIKRAGAGQIGQFESDTDFAIQFTMADRMIRFRLPLPAMEQMPKYDGRHRPLSVAQRKEKLEQACRSKARSLLLVIKAKLESVESGIETVEQAFLANVVMADGSTVYEQISGPLALEYQSGRPSPSGLLPAPGAAA